MKNQDLIQDILTAYGVQKNSKFREDAYTIEYYTKAFNGFVKTPIYKIIFIAFKKVIKNIFNYIFEILKTIIASIGITILKILEVYKIFEPFIRMIRLLKVKRKYKGIYYNGRKRSQATAPKLFKV